MDIDWLTVIAQIVNFVGLVWLLHRFLYAPIVNVITARETALEDRFDEARTMREEARRNIDEYETKRSELERTREQYLHDARAEARRTLAALLEQAQAEAEGARRRLSEQLEAERRELEQRLQETIVRQAGAASEHLLQELAGRSAADGVIDAFEERLQAEVDAAKTDVAWLHQVEPPLTLRLSFDASADQRQRLRAILEAATGQTFGDEDVTFIYEPSLLLGVELHYDGSVLTWHARHVLASWEAEALRQIGRIGIAGVSGPDRGPGQEPDTDAEPAGGVDAGQGG